MVLWYLIISISILGFTLTPGYILALDMIFTPEVTLSTTTNPSYLFYLLLKIFSFVLPVWLLQKIILLATFTLAGIGAHKLVQYVMQGKKTAAYGSWPYYFAGILYTINPFTYTRLMAGQFAVLLGYALLPFAAYYTLRFLRGRTIQNAATLTALFVVIGIVSIHSLGLAFIIAACLAAAAIAFARPSKTKLLHASKYAAIGLLAFCVLSSYWLIPLATGNSNLSDTVSGFNSQDTQAFATQPGDVGLVLNVLALQGFWGDDKNLYILPQDQYDWWLVPLVALWLLVLAGVYYGFKKNKPISSALAAIGFFGFMLALGTAGTLFAGFNQFLFDHVPFFAGYREPQKFAALIALAYIYFGAWGTAFLLQRFTGALKKVCIVVLLLLPIACCPILLFGGNGQLKSTDYPADWYQVNTYLKTHAADTKTVFLPWHLYMPFSFTDRVIASPASNFFETKILASKDPEIGNASSYTTDAATKQLQTAILPNAAKSNDLASDLHAMGIGYIVLVKGYDSEKYSYLEQKMGIELELETQNLILYRVKAE